jgi:hypothetical protein
MRLSSRRSGQIPVDVQPLGIARQQDHPALAGFFLLFLLLGLGLGLCGTACRFLLCWRLFLLGLLGNQRLQFPAHQLDQIRFTELGVTGDVVLLGDGVQLLHGLVPQVFEQSF